MERLAVSGIGLGHAAGRKTIRVAISGFDYKENHY
jgi:hypothetical protein